MFDAEYFRDRLKCQVDQVGGNPVVRLALKGGEEYLIRDVVETTPGYVLLNVHPFNAIAGIEAPSSSAYSRVPTGGYHPTAVSYDAISHVYLSTTTEGQRPKVGFNPSSTG